MSTPAIERLKKFAEPTLRNTSSTMTSLLCTVRFSTRQRPTLRRKCCGSGSMTLRCRSWFTVRLMIGAASAGSRVPEPSRITFTPRAAAARMCGYSSKRWSPPGYSQKYWSSM